MTDEPLAIALPMDAIREFCHRHRIRKLSLFGSVVREDFRADSDVDVLVEFEAGYRPGLAFFSMGDELSAILGKPVDFNTEGWLSERFREDVLAEARPVYVAA
jgi:predicted nucleotidyltransferase